MAENDSFKVAVYGSHGIKKKVFLSLFFKILTHNSEIISHNSDKKNQLVILFFSWLRIMSLYHTLLAFFSSELTLSIELNRFKKSELGDENVHLRKKKVRIVR